MNLVIPILHFCKQYGLERTYWIAYSGGLDSHVLLHLFYLVRKEFAINFEVIHINHQLNVKANDWQNHCAATCKLYDIKFHVHQLTWNLSSGESLENEARKKRYALFATHLKASDILVTAHHQDDQAETMLLQLTRGAGLPGLSGMPAIKSLTVGRHARPLLNFSKTDLKQHAEEYQLHWIEDDSNKKIDFTRNFLRQEILPILQERWPTVAAILSRSANHIAEAESLLQEFALELMHKVSGKYTHTLSVQALLTLSKPQQKLVLRKWIKQFNFILPNEKRLETILDNMLLAAWDKMPVIKWENIELRRYQDDLFVMQVRSDEHLDTTIAWDFKTPLILPQGILTAQLVQGRGLKSTIESVIVGYRKGGESLHLTNRKGRKSLKKLFQEWHILPWERNGIPLLFLGTQLIQVVGHVIAHPFIAEGLEWGYEIEYLKK